MHACMVAVMGEGMVAVTGAGMVAVTGAGMVAVRDACRHGCSHECRHGCSQRCMQAWLQSEMHAGMVAVVFLFRDAALIARNHPQPLSNLDSPTTWQPVTYIVQPLGTIL